MKKILALSIVITSTLILSCDLIRSIFYDFFFIDGQRYGRTERRSAKNRHDGIRVWQAIMSVDDFEANRLGIPSSPVKSKDKLATTWAKIKI